MADPCIGCGLSINPISRNLELNVISEAWPYFCDVDVYGGVHCDPGTSKLWVEPDTSFLFGTTLAGFSRQLNLLAPGVPTVVSTTPVLEIDNTSPCRSANVAEWIAPAQIEYQGGRDWVARVDLQVNINATGFLNSQQWAFDSRGLVPTPPFGYLFRNGMGARNRGYVLGPGAVRTLAFRYIITASPGFVPEVAFVTASSVECVVLGVTF